MTDDIPVGVTRNEDGSVDVQPIAYESCPVCDNEHFWAIAQFKSDWNPERASRTECEECGSEFELIATQVTGGNFDD